MRGATEILLFLYMAGAGLADRSDYVNKSDGARTCLGLVRGEVVVRVGTVVWAEAGENVDKDEGNG